jgi:AcrR family transcriptional regulator
VGVPKIDARTVAEHHDLHLSRLLDAALGFVGEHDVESLTLAELAKRTGRSRASLYAYFGSTDEMRIALCDHALTAWIGDLLDDVERVTNPSDRLDRFIAAQIAQHNDPTVDRVLAYVLGQQHEPFRTRLRTITEPLSAQLLSIIEQLGVSPPTRAATVVQGAIAAAYDQVRDGADPDAVTDDTIAFVRAGLNALRESNRQRGQPLTRQDTSAAHRDARSDARARMRPAPGALAMRTTPSVPAALAAAMPSTHAVRPRPARLFWTRPVHVATAQLVWACVGFVSGATGTGGAALHIVLGLSLVAILAWSVRVLAPARVAPGARRIALALAVAASAVALVARSQQLEAAVVVHVALAVVLLIGLILITRAAWRGRGTATIVPAPI